jgi:citrate synthase
LTYPDHNTKFKEKSKSHVYYSINPRRMVAPVSDMTWKTSIADVQVDDVIIRGHKLSDLVGSVTYSDMAFLLIRGSLPSGPERAMLDAILVSLVDHGISPAAIIARTLASCGTPMQASMAGAMLSIADWHGGSGEEVAKILASVVADRAVMDPGGVDPIHALVEKPSGGSQRVPGFGHPQHTDGDPRARQLLTLAAKLGAAGVHTAALLDLGEALAAKTGRPSLRVANVTGAIAALLLDLGFPWASVRGIVISARSLGLTAHIVEELDQGNKWRHAPADQVTYTGPPALTRD